MRINVLLAASSLFGFTSISRGADELLPAPREKKVLEVPKELRESLKLDPFYKKYFDCKGIPILTSEKVTDEGILEANHLICQTFAKNKFRYVRYDKRAKDK